MIEEPMPQTALVEALGHYSRRDVACPRPDLDFKTIQASINRLHASGVIMNVFGKEDAPLGSTRKADRWAIDYEHTLNLTKFKLDLIKERIEQQGEVTEVFACTNPQCARRYADTEMPTLTKVDELDQARLRRFKEKQDQVFGEVTRQGAAYRAALERRREQVLEQQQAAVNARQFARADALAQQLTAIEQDLDNIDYYVVAQPNGLLTKVETNCQYCPNCTNPLGAARPELDRWRVVAKRVTVRGDAILADGAALREQYEAQFGVFEEWVDRAEQAHCRYVKAAVRLQHERRLGDDQDQRLGAQEEDKLEIVLQDAWGRPFEGISQMMMMTPEDGAAAGEKKKIPWLRGGTAGTPSRPSAAPSTSNGALRPVSHLKRKDVPDDGEEVVRVSDFGVDDEGDTSPKVYGDVHVTVGGQLKALAQVTQYDVQVMSTREHEDYFEKCRELYDDEFF